MMDERIYASMYECMNACMYGRMCLVQARHGAQRVSGSVHRTPVHDGCGVGQGADHAGGE